MGEYFSGDDLDEFTRARRTYGPRDGALYMTTHEACWLEVHDKAPESVRYTVADIMSRAAEVLGERGMIVGARESDRNRKLVAVLTEYLYAAIHAR